MSDEKKWDDGSIIITNPEWKQRVFIAHPERIFIMFLILLCFILVVII